MSSCAEVKVGGAMLFAQADCAPLTVRDVMVWLALALMLTLAVDALADARGRTR